METSFSILTLGMAAAGVVVGGLLAWILRSRMASSELEDVVDDWQSRLRKETHENKRLTGENHSLNAALDAERTLLQNSNMRPLRAAPSYSR